MLCQRNSSEHSVSDPYIRDRYFLEKPSNVVSITNQFGKYRGVQYNVGLDAHEIKLHCRFQNTELQNIHAYLLNAIGNK